MVQHGSERSQIGTEPASGDARLEEHLDGEIFAFDPDLADEHDLAATFPVLRGRKTQAAVLALGLALLLLVAQVPVLGGLVTAAACFVSLGAIVRTRFGQRPRGTPEPFVPPPPSAAAA